MNYLISKRLLKFTNQLGLKRFKSKITFRIDKRLCKFALEILKYRIKRNKHKEQFFVVKTSFYHKFESMMKLKFENRAQCFERCSLRSYGGQISDDRFYPSGVNHGFMGREFSSFTQ